MARSVFIAAIAAAFLAASASAQTNVWTGPDESRRGHLVGHALDNMQTAITEICFPFILQGAEPNAWTRNQRAGVVWRPDTGVFQGLTTYQVGGSSATSVGVGDRGNGRECTLEPDNRVDSGEALALLRAQIARIPFEMREAAHIFPPGNYAQRIVLCAPADGPQVVMIASVNAADRPRNAPALIASFAIMPSRDSRCDAPAS